MITPQSDPTSALFVWRIQRPYSYALLVAGFALGVRTVLCLFKAAERSQNDKNDKSTKSPSRLSYWKAFKYNFVGAGWGGQIADYWHPYFIGCLELLTYPVLMKTGNWTFIGAWIGLKTLAQWKTWSEERRSFNRFLIGNALVLLASFGLLSRFVHA